MGTVEFNAGGKGGNPLMDHPRRVEILLAASCYSNRDKLQPDGPLGSYADYTLQPCVLQTVRVTSLCCQTLCGKKYFGGHHDLSFSHHVTHKACTVFLQLAQSYSFFWDLLEQRGLKIRFSYTFSPGYFESSLLFDNHHTMCFFQES